jgi:hypothetical protein
VGVAGGMGMRKGEGKKERKKEERDAAHGLE